LDKEIFRYILLEVASCWCIYNIVVGKQEWLEKDTEMDPKEIGLVGGIVKCINVAG
jgi:hypothetical protein